MTLMAWTHVAYLTAGVVVTWWVAHMLRRHGPSFAAAGNRYDAETGPAMCHLLVVGFCLISFGIVSIALSTGATANTVQACIENLSTKLGWVVVIVGVLHFMMISVFAAMGKHDAPRPKKNFAHSASDLVDSRYDV